MAENENPNKEEAKVERRSSESSTSKLAGDLAETVQSETEKGYLGVKVDPRPNSDWSLESGPDAPSAVEDERTGMAHTFRTRSEDE